MALDLNLLPHLSERALREEAERRGIVAAELEREGLIEAIRQHEARLLTVPPPASASEPRWPLEGARTLLDRVVGLARSAIETARGGSKSGEPPAPVEPPEPIRTRSLARLLEEQGHLERALSIVRELTAEAPDDDELARWARHLARRIAERELAARAKRARGVELVTAAGLRGVAWRVDEVGLTRARALLGAEGQLTLRVIRVLAHPDRSVETRHDDQSPLEPAGWALIDAPPHARLIVSVGLAEGGRFVSVAHAA